MGDSSISRLGNSRYLKKCPVGCKSTLEATDIILVEGPLLKCGECGQLVSQMTEEVYLKSVADLDIPEGTLPQADFNDRLYRLHKKRLKKISRLTGLPPHQTRLLDVGCSSGSFLASARKLGYLGTGVEPAGEPVKTAKGYGLDVKQGFLYDMHFSDNYFDVITLFEVIEHLKDPLELLRECRRILKTGGIMVIGTGNTDSWTVRFMKNNWDYFMNHGGHVSFYNPKTMSKLAKESGFNVVKIETRRVSLYRKEQVSKFRFTISKIIREVLGISAKLLKKGHDLLLFLRKS